MKLKMRRALARESYEEKIRKVGQLIGLVKSVRGKSAKLRLAREKTGVNELRRRRVRVGG
jgi:hypothetical protein